MRKRGKRFSLTDFHENRKRSLAGKKSKSKLETLTFFARTKKVSHSLSLSTPKDFQFGKKMAKLDCGSVENKFLSLSDDPERVGLRYFPIQFKRPLREVQKKPFLL